MKHIKILGEIVRVCSCCGRIVHTKDTTELTWLPLCSTCGSWYRKPAVKCTVIEQTHYGRNFSERANYFRVGVAEVASSVNLAGRSRVFLNWKGFGTDYYYLKSNPDDTCEFIIPVDKWASFKATVEAYNDKFAV